jgi:hypothetical protein
MKQAQGKTRVFHRYRSVFDTRWCDRGGGADDSDVTALPGVVKSAWCNDERTWFQEQIEDRAAEEGRVFVVRAVPTDEGTHTEKQLLSLACSQVAKERCSASPWIALLLAYAAGKQGLFELSRPRDGLVPPFPSGAVATSTYLMSALPSAATMAGGAEEFLGG